MRRAGTCFLLGISLALALFFFADRVACLFQKPYKSAIWGWDNTFYYFWLRGPLVRGDFDFSRDMAETHTLPEAQRLRYLAAPRGTPDHPLNKYGLGWAVAEYPFYRLADGLAWVSGQPRDGYGPLYQFLLHLGQLFYGLAGLALSWRIVRRWVPDPEALWGVLLCWLGSFLFLYQTSILSMAHNTLFFALAACTLCALKVEEGSASGRLPAGVSFFAGLALITRYQAAVYLFFPAWAALRDVRRRRALHPGWLCGLAPVALQAWAWRREFGSWVVYSYRGEAFDWLHPHSWEILVSPFHGLFYWSPALLLGLAGFLWWARRTGGAVRRLWGASLVAAWYVNASWWAWWFGAAYGARGFEGCVLFFMLGTAWLLWRLRERPWARGAVLAALVVLAAANVGLSYQARKNRLPEEAPVTHAEMLRALGF